MNILEILELKKMSFTKSELKIYKEIKTNPDEILRTTTMSNLAEKYNISQPTFTRFLKKLGYDNFFDFKQDIYIISKNDIQTEDKISLNRIESYAGLIVKLQNFISKDDYNEISEMIYSARNIITLGMHKSYLSAQMMSYNLMKLSLTSFAFNNDNAYEIQNFISKNDIVMVFSSSGNTHKNTLETLHELGVPIILITQNNKTVSKKYATKVLFIPSSQNQHMKYYLENQIVFMVVTDMITSYLAKLISKKKEG